MTTTAPSTPQAPVRTLCGGRHYTYIAEFLSSMGSLRETIEQIACILAADNPHFDRETFGREAGPWHAPDSFTLDEFRANLVTAVGIAEWLALRSSKRVADWRDRYDDFPRPFLEGTRGRSLTAARQAWVLVARHRGVHQAARSAQATAAAGAVFAADRRGAAPS